MANIDIKEWQIGENTYKFKDEVARQQLATKQDAITRVTASADSYTGTPSVTPTWNNGTLDFAFHNIKGGQGVKGDTVILGNEEEYTLYNTEGDNTDGAMTQSAVTNRFNEILGRVVVAFEALYNVLTSAIFKDDVSNKMSALQVAIRRFGDIPLVGLTISGDDAVVGADGVTSKYSVNYIPEYTTQEGVTWSIESGGSYATIDSLDGTLTVLEGASSSSVVIRATSNKNNTIYAEKTISVTAVAYTELSYIQAGAGVYIDTGIKMDSDVTLEIKGAHSGSSDTEMVGGCRTSNDDRTQIFINNLHELTIYVGNNKAQSKSNDTDPIIITTSVTTPFASFSNGYHEYIQNTLTACGINNGLNFWLFDVNYNGSPVASIISCNIYYAKMYKGDTLVRNFVPILVGSTPKMLDNVTKRIFDFNGSGNINYE